MIKITDIFNKISKRNLFYFALLIILIIVSIILQRITTSQKTQPIPSTPSVVAPSIEEEIIPTIKDTEVSQKLTFTWGISPTEFPSTIKNYIITKPLINVDTINNLSNQLGFTRSDKQRSIKNTTYIWSNTAASLFASTTQNQIIYKRTDSKVENSNSITSNEAIDITRNLLQKYFGDQFVTSLDNNPTVQFKKFNKGDYEPQEVSDPTTATFIEVFYRQNIDSLPVSSLSGTSDILSVAIDTNRELYRLAIYGGYLDIKEQNIVNVIDFEKLKQIAPDKATRISAIKSISYESQFGNTASINVAVNSLQLGYFLRNDNSLFPVFYISGNVSLKNLPTLPVVYIVSASAN